MNIHKFHAIHCTVFLFLPFITDYPFSSKYKSSVSLSCLTYELICLFIQLHQREHRLLSFRNITVIMFITYPSSYASKLLTSLPWVIYQFEYLNPRVYMIDFGIITLFTANSSSSSFLICLYAYATPLPPISSPPGPQSPSPFIKKIDVACRSP